MTMSRNLQTRKQTKHAAPSAKAAARKPDTQKVVLVGTYKGDMLTKWPKWYCYPVRRADKISDADAAKINELWLFKGTAEQKVYRAEFVGVKMREELVRDYDYPATGKAHGERYLLFKKAAAYHFRDMPPEEAERVYVRTADFARSPKVRKQLKAYLESPDRADPDLAKLLPTIVTKVPRENLRVSEWSTEWGLFSWDEITPVKKPPKGILTAVELFAGAGGLSIGLERAGIHVVLANEIMPDFAATLAANHPNTNVINEDIHKIDFRAELKKLGLESVDVLSGGPPCQGFSTIGSKNRQDPRNSLFYEYLRAVSETHPKYTIFENVSGFKRMYDGFAYD